MSFEDEAKKLVVQQKKKCNYKRNSKALSYCWDMKDIQGFEDYIKEKGLEDCVSLYGIPFTQEEYDHNGQYVIYANRKLNLSITVEHYNRYKDMKDIKGIYMDIPSCWREDISYLE